MASKTIQKINFKPDFVALGLGGTGMMSLLWSIAEGKKVVGVEMRGDPHLGVHWNIREDLYHQLGLIDQKMLKRYGPKRIPKRDNGQIFKLAELFYSSRTVSGDIVADEIISGYTPGEHIVGTIQHVEFIDDRYIGGIPTRKVTHLEAPKAPSKPNARKIRSNVEDILDGPSTFQASAESLLTLLRRYLEAIEKMDFDQKAEPRLALFTHHRVLPEGGFKVLKNGKARIFIEELQELDMKGRFMRVRMPGTKTIDLGIPELFMISQGFRSDDAKKLGFVQKEVTVDHNDGLGPRVAQADYMAGLFEILVDGRLRRRIASEFDAKGEEYWTRQIAVGHENDPEVAWVLVEVPEFMTFDPVASGLVSKAVDPDSAEYYAAYHKLQMDFFIKQAALVLDMPENDVRSAQLVYGPKMFTLVEKMGDDPVVAANGVVAGDSFGNGHFMTSGGAMTGMIGHSYRILEFWTERAKGKRFSSALQNLKQHIIDDTKAWLKVSQSEFSAALPVNFGKERAKKLQHHQDKVVQYRKHHSELRKKRHSIAPLNLSDWRRPVIKPGKVISKPLPKISNFHPHLVNS